MTPVAREYGTRISVKHISAESSGKTLGHFCLTDWSKPDTVNAVETITNAIAETYRSGKELVVKPMGICAGITLIRSKSKVEAEINVSGVSHHIKFKTHSRADDIQLQKILAERIFALSILPASVLDSIASFDSITFQVGHKNGHVMDYRDINLYRFTKTDVVVFSNEFNEGDSGNYIIPKSSKIQKHNLVCVADVNPDPINFPEPSV